MKPSEKFKRIYQNKFEKCLAFYIGIFLCMYRPGISAGKRNLYEYNVYFLVQK